MKNKSSFGRGITLFISISGAIAAIILTITYIFI